MASVFHLTSPATGLELDKSGLGEVSFTVSNAAGRALRARAVVVPLGSTQAGWLSVVGDAERRLAADGTEQFTVRVAVPAGTSEGAYSFRLDVISEENPDEDFTEGPVVAIEVPTTETPKKPFPWWIPAVVAGVLVLGALVFWLAKRGGGKVEVPDLARMTVAAAEKALTAAELAIGTTTEEESDDPPGTILRQDPGPEKKVAKDTEVALVVATDQKRRAENERLAAEQRAAEEKRRVENERLAAEQRAAEEKRRVENERLAAEQRAAEEQRRAENERLAAEQRAAELARIAAAEREAEAARELAMYPGGTLRVFCEAGYVATFHAKWIDQNGNPQSWSSGALPLGQRRSKSIPPLSRNIEVWADGHGTIPRNPIFRDRNADLTKEYKVYGTIFGPAWTKQ